MKLIRTFLIGLWLSIGIVRAEGAETTLKKVTTPAEISKAAAGLAACASDTARACARIIDITGVKKGMFLEGAEGAPQVNFLVIDKNEKLSLALAGQCKAARIYLISEDRKAVAAMRSAIDARKLYGRITCRAEKLESIFFPTFFFDVVIVNRTALKESGFKEVYRLLKPGKRAFFLGSYELEGFLEKLAAPGVENSLVASKPAASVLFRGYDETDNEYLELPLTRLWVTSADDRFIRKADKIDAKFQPLGFNYPGYLTSLLRGERGEVVTDYEPRYNFDLFKRVPLDAYTGKVVKPEQTYPGQEMDVYGLRGIKAKKRYAFPEGIDHTHSRKICSTRYRIRAGKQVVEKFNVEEEKKNQKDPKVAALLKQLEEVKAAAGGNLEDPKVQAAADRILREFVKLGKPPPFEYALMNYHGNIGARDLQTDKLMWENKLSAAGLFRNCCPVFMYVNGVVYKTTYSALLALHPLTGKLLWWHRSGQNCCAHLNISRSLIYQPNTWSFNSAHMQAFISQKYAGPVPTGDRLVKGSGRVKAAAAKASPDDWPMYHYDACRTGAAPGQKVSLPFKLRWKFATGGKVRSSPAVVDGTVYVGSCDHKFYAIDAETGKQRWVFFADDEIRSSPCVWKNAVYFGCDDGKVYALDKDTGQLIWSYKTATTTPGSLHYFHGSSRNIGEYKKMLASRSYTPLCFNGQPLSTPGVVRSSPVVADGVLYVGTGLGIDGRPCWGYLYALDAATGRLKWKITEPDITMDREEAARGITSPPCYYDNEVHFTYGVYTAVEAKKGKLTLKGGTLAEGERTHGNSKCRPQYTRRDNKVVNYWINFNRGIRGALTLAKDKRTALVVTGAGELELFLWKKQKPVYFGIRVWAVDLNTGQVKWEGRYNREIKKEGRGWKRWAGPLPYEQPAAVHNGRVYVAGEKEIAVFDLEKGGKENLVFEHVTKFKARGRLRTYDYSVCPWNERIFRPLRVLTGPADILFTSPAVAGGHLFAGSDDGAVYAWNLDEKEDQVKPVWKHEIGQGVKIRSSPAVARGRLYLGADNGCVYCFGK